MKELLKNMPDLSRDQQEMLAAMLRSLVYAYEHRNDDMSHIPGHPGSEAYLNAKMNHGIQLMNELNIPKAE